MQRDSGITISNITATMHNIFFPAFFNSTSPGKKRQETCDLVNLIYQSGRTPVLEEAMTSRFYCFARKSQKINARKYGLSKKLDSRFHRPISENFKASLSTVPWARVVNFWQSESIKSLSFWRVFEEAAAILIAIECKYMLLRAFFNSLPNFFDIETNFPQNYNK